ncbi:MAG: U32 family peptidase [Gammaproteobacteria bacterium]|uniref:U32 family peptidase n=1 Tax=Candidatus Thiopontia autotrophica TaxID=2841688 RepID=A0A8J6TXA4_9GAMM|nr:U32 family peptidase [Candidatus Thiopontia autotrophica]MBL6968870.1 U32 family peptidase [Gammaproteobacteria bacterium]
MKREIELLAPGGDIDSIKAAILAGADAVYCGLDRFNARNRAENITFENLNGIIRLAHKHRCEIFLTVNIIIVESEIPALLTMLNRLVNTRIDGIIVQDLGLLYLLSKYFPTLRVHASTQLTTHNPGQIKFLHHLGVTRTNLSRELNLDEIKKLSSVAHESGMLTEVFVHGSNCISFSGLCYMSSLHGGNSGNRGRCSQPCRDQYLTTAEGRDFPLNIKDNSAYSDLGALHDAGVDSIKIEGRIKKYHYVHTVVDAWRKQLQQFYEQGTTSIDDGDLRKVFNRDFSNSFLQSSIGRETFIDNPRDNSALHRSRQGGVSTTDSLTVAKRELYELKTEIIINVREGIEGLSIEQAPLRITASGSAGTPLGLLIETPEEAFTISSDTNLTQLIDATGGKGLHNDEGKKSLPHIDHQFLLKRLRPINETEYFIDDLNLDKLQDGLTLPFRSLTKIKIEILFVLNGSRERVSPVEMPALKRSGEEIKHSLSLLISSRDDLDLSVDGVAEIYFQLPSSTQDSSAELIELFNDSPQLVPWFPAVLIGEEYHAAVEFLHQLKPKKIVTNNSGVAYEAYQRGIPWVAGPYMNLVNSFSLLCLKENFNCSGAFVSNELNREQIKRIKKPAGFDLYYSMSHPIVLMTSRVCMFHPVTGCEKNIVDDKCIQRCDKSSSITNLKQVSFIIDKAKGGYHSVYNEYDFLNTDIVKDIPNTFSSFLIDLRDIKTNTRVEIEKPDIVRLFMQHLNGDSKATEQLNQGISPSTQTQYRQGI